LSPLESIITEQLVEEAYIPQAAKLPINPSILMNSYTKNCVFSADEAGLGLCDSRIAIWKFIECDPGQYIIMNTSNSRFLSANEKGVYEADSSGSNESKWSITLSSMRSNANSRGWLIQSLSLTNHYLTYIETK
jgi:hypothetical protein